LLGEKNNILNLWDRQCVQKKYEFIGGLR